jgi:hypothetical protein
MERIASPPLSDTLDSITVILGPFQFIYWLPKALATRDHSQSFATPRTRPGPGS